MPVSNELLDSLLADFKKPGKTYANLEEARQDVFHYIEMFYIPKRRHGFSNGLSPVEYERQYFERLKVSNEAGVIQSLVTVFSRYSSIS